MIENIAEPADSAWAAKKSRATQFADSKNAPGTNYPSKITEANQKKRMSLRLPPEEYAVLCRGILKRDGWRCRNCKSRCNLHVHHIIFRSAEGPDEDWNLCTLCSSCHDGIHKDIQDGIMGLVIEQPADANFRLVFIWAPGWKPS